MSDHFPQSNAHRQQSLRESRRKAGLKEVRNLWCYPEDEKRVREFVAQTTEARSVNGEVPASVCRSKKGNA